MSGRTDHAAAAAADGIVPVRAARAAMAAGVLTKVEHERWTEPSHLKVEADERARSDLMTELPGEPQPSRLRRELGR